MQYIQIDNFNSSINIITKDDGSGEVLIFDSLKEAEDTLEENCQDGQVVPLGMNIIETIKDLIFSMDQALNPEQYESSKKLLNIDFLDAALCKADELGFKEELINYRNIKKTLKS
jgi:hypothetical protein